MFAMRDLRAGCPWRLRCLCLTIALLLAAEMVCADGLLAAADLTGMSIEELMDLRITSVAKRSQKVSEAAAAIFVITAEDLRRSGATTIAEALRMVPGLEVAHINANQWAISSRGFNGRFANKLLVLIDGRTIYTPFYSGVFWSLENPPLEDIERIEVIRGPGASLWGANAVNGVINVITKSAADTQGGLLAGGMGTEERAFGSVRYGGRVGERLAYRLFGTGAEVDSGSRAGDTEGQDDWRRTSGGARLDWNPTNADAIMLETALQINTSGQEYLLTRIEQPLPLVKAADDKGANAHLNSRWTRNWDSGAESTLQAYLDRAEGRSIAMDWTTDILDLDLQHRLALGRINTLSIGIGYRFTRSETETDGFVRLIPATREDDLLSAFVQDEIALVADTLFLTLGSKFEHNDYTGFEVQPGGRLLWKVNNHNSLWTAVSRAVRTPSRGESDAYFPNTVLPPSAMTGDLPTQVIFFGSTDFDSESLWAYELGYKSQASSTLSLDLALFYNRYDELRTVEPVGTPQVRFSTVPYLQIGSEVGNNMQGEVYGLEAALDWKPTEYWSLRPAYTYTRMRLWRSDNSLDTVSEAAEDEVPRHQLSLRSLLDLPGGVELDGWLRYVDDLDAQGVPAYWTFDLRLGYKPMRNLELSLVGQNLTDRRHPEFSPELLETLPTEVERSVYGKLTWRF